MYSKTCYGYDADEADRGYYGESSYTHKTWYDAAGLEHMVATMRMYDSLRRKLACEGGTVADLRTLTDLLTSSFYISGFHGDAEAKLSDPKSVKKALTDAGQYDVHFEIRRLDYGLPAYYLARTSHDWWGTYGLQVEDIYRSEDFLIEDPRFVKFMNAGRGEYYLRLAPFRGKVAQMPHMKHRNSVDSFLYTLGRSVFQGAWHVDQRFAFIVADAFDAPVLKAAIELVYMILSIDLYALRRNLNEDMHHFFTKIYPNETIVQLMKMLPSLTDEQFAALSRGASASYLTITDRFNRFLRTEVYWRTFETAHMPLWKLILANMKRLNIVAAQTTNQDEMKEARESLQTGARECVQCLLSV